MTEIRPQLEVLEFLSELQPWHVELAVKIARQVGDDPQWLIDERNAGRAGFWQVGRTLVVTQIISDDTVREFFVYGVAGSGIIKVLDCVARDVRTIAAEFDCSRIGGNVRRRGLEKLYQLLGGEPIYTYYRLEI